MATTTDKYILELETAKAERGIDRTQKGFGGMLAGLGRLGPAAAAAGAALAGMAAVRGIADKITEMDDLAKAARNAGAAASPEAFEGFQVARNLLGEMGLSAAESDRAFKNMTTRLQEAADTGKGPAADAFAKISESITDANGNLVDMPQLFAAVTSALQDGTLSMTDARKILGDVVGPKILGGFEDLANKGMGVSEALADVKANSDIISLEGANNAEAFGDTMGRIKEVLGQVGTTIVTALLPYLNEMAEGVLANLPAIVEGVKGAFSALEPVFSLLGTIIKDILWPALQLIFDILGAVASAISPLVETAVPALVWIFEKLAGVVQGVIDFFKAAIDIMVTIGNKIKELGSAVSGVFGSVGDGAKNMAKGAYDSVTGWFGKMYDEVVGNSIIPDMAKEVLSEFDGMGSGMVDFVKSAVGGVTSAMTTLGNAVANKFEEVTGISMSGLKNQVSSMSNYLTTSVSNLASSIGSKLSGLWNRVSSSASSIGDLFGGFSFSNPFENFAGFFAKGGMIPAGQFGVAGESGPELISGPANVTPMTGMGGNVTYNINAVDASSFRSLLAQDPEFVHRVVQRGSNSANIGRR